MTCQQCMKRPANVQITQMINNQKSVLYLCEQCAGAREDLINNFSFNMGNLLASIMENMQGFTHLPITENVEQCDVCGMTYDEFTRLGKFGCENCYRVFSSRLMPIFRRLHGNTRHTGKVPAKANTERRTAKEIFSLRTQLEEAVKNEQYEKAARIRDKIRQLESDPKKVGDA